MNREEAKTIVHAIVCAYPNYKPDNLTETVNIWAAMLKDYEFRHISAALKAYILQDTKGFAPSVGQIVDMLTEKSEMTEMDAWAKVSKAIKNGLYGSEEEFEKLPETVKKAVGSPHQLSSWATMPHDTVQSVVQSNFLRTYRVIVERERRAEKTPIELEQAIAERRRLPEDRKKRFIAIAEEVE